MSHALTRGIQIHVEPRFHPERSDPAHHHWFFSYTVRIANRGETPVELTHRHWIITNARGETEEVRGPGVVGEQPVLAPGDAFEYTSFCPLDTSLGAMHGSFRMVLPDGTAFDATVAPFTLADPSDLN